MSLWFFSLMALVSFVAGATASIVGFGIGSLLTPFMAARYGTDVAIAAIALPHLSGGLLRGWRLRRFLDARVLVRFGILSTVGGLAGALIFAQLAPAALGRVLGALLVLTATAGIAGWSERWKPRGPLVWVLGALSGFFGGVVGNQGGLRAAALSAFHLEPRAFVATSTIIGVMIDLVRTPVYLYRAGGELTRLWPLVALTIIGVLAGTLAGERLLLGLSRERFRQIVSVAVGLLGLWFLFRPS
ncbi:MAG TPA: sulfite exporter TauE/SafE family protein [Burkholderiales bacterium]|nr:sulfite exporter TauE/SafE family protein [Burkholderiales bacterium]